MAESAIIIGSGLGGLECAFILAKHGVKVTVLEQGAQIGGCLQTFVRCGKIFDTGFHYVGGLEKGQSLYPLFNYFSLLDLPWRKLDESCFDKIMLGEKEFSLSNGYGQFVESLAKEFPLQKDNLQKYISVLKSVGDNILSAFSTETDKSVNELFSKSAYAFLEETISDPLLRDVLSGSSLKMELDAASLPLYVFAQINSSYIQSAWRLDGHGSAISEHLAKSIISMGGEVRTHSKVTSLRESEGRITEVEINGQEILSADWIISDAHPSTTLDLLKDSKAIRNVYRKRISSLKNSFGMFTVNVSLKKDTVPYRDSNMFIYSKGACLWNMSCQKTDRILVSYYVPEGKDKAYATAMDILCPLDYSEVQKWSSSPLMRRGMEYDSFKARKAQECLELASEWIPELKDGVEAVFTSSPLTYESYLGNPFGTAYGIKKDCNSPLTTFLSARTPLSNLLLTGQNLNLHGILGVSMTSFLTCSEILGMDVLRSEIIANM